MSPTNPRATARRGLVASACVAILLVAACGADATSGEEPDERVEVRIVLDWTPNTNHTGIFVAEELGYYEEAGIELTVLPFSQAGVQNVMMNDGAEFGISGANGVIHSRARGEDLTMVLNLQQQSSAAAAVAADHPEIERPSDLDGKTFASWGAGEALSEVGEMIRNDGGTGEFGQVMLGTSSYETLYAGRADFAQALTTWEGVEAELRGQPLQFFFPADYGVTVTPAEIGIAVRASYVAENEDLVERFVQATRRGYEHALEDPDGAAEILIASNPDATLEEELVGRSQRLLSEEYWPDASGGIGEADLEAWQDYIDHLAEGGFLVDESGEPLDEPPAVEDVVTNRFLE